MSLRTRLSLIAAAAVAVAVVAVSALAWLLIREELHRQLLSQLDSNARTIAAQPQRWRYLPQPSTIDEHDRGPGDRHGGRDDVGPRWQLLDPHGVPVTAALPVTAAARRVAAGQAPRAVDVVEVSGRDYRMLTMPATGGGAVQVALPLEQTEETLRRLSVLLGAGCLGGILLAGLLGRSVAWTGIVPIQRLTAAVEHVAATQDLQAPIPITGRDEVARLAGSFNEMLAALHTSRTAQRALVEDAGHELRTPLTSLRTNIELLVRADAEPADGRVLPAEDRARLLRDLETEVVELTALTNELIDLAREETSPEQAEPVDLTEIVAAAVQRCRARTTGVAFELHAHPATVVGRAVALERTVLNLLDNAAKWSPPGGVVTVTVTQSAETAVVTVADSGPGVDDADLPHIFERFYRAPAGRSKPGSGLGLAIVAQTVAQHGGTVSAARSGTGGALLTVTLPAAGAAA